MRRRGRAYDRERALRGRMLHETIAGLDRVSQELLESASPSRQSPSSRSPPLPSRSPNGKVLIRHATTPQNGAPLSRAARDAIHKIERAAADINRLYHLDNGATVRRSLRSPPGVAQLTSSQITISQIPILPISTFSTRTEQRPLRKKENCTKYRLARQPAGEPDLRNPASCQCNL